MDRNYETRMLKILYGPGPDGLQDVLDAVSKMPVPEDMGAVLLTRMYGGPGKAAGTDYERSVYRTASRTDYLPGLFPADLFRTRTYEAMQPCTGIILYHDGLDLHALTEHAYGTANTVLRYMPAENYDRAWKYLGKTDWKSWHGIMRLTVPVHDAIPEIMSLARPCRLVPA